MSPQRCPSCRTLREADEEPRCIGCGADGRNLLPTRSEPRPQVMKEAKRDSKWAFGLLLGIGVLGILGIFMESQHGGLLIASSAAGLVGAVALIARTSRAAPDSTGPSLLQLAATMLLCGMALLFGVGILLGFVCMKLEGLN